jgi:hypothetical protein
MSARRIARHAALLLALCATTAGPVRAAGGEEYVYSPADTLAAMEMHSPLAACVVRLEVGGVGFDPYAVGAQGELGPVQLHPRGLLPLYIRWSGGASPYDPYTSIAFLDWAIERGYGPQWSAWRYCA